MEAQRTFHKEEKIHTVILQIGKLQEQMFPWTFAHLQNVPVSMHTCVCLCVFVHALGGGRGEKVVGTELQKEGILEDNFFGLSLCNSWEWPRRPKYGWISVPRDCPCHGLDARISVRTPAAAALSPETNCPGYTNTTSFPTRSIPFAHKYSCLVQKKT